MATIDDYLLDETGAAVLDETSANILIPNIPVGVAKWWNDNLLDETGATILDQTLDTIRMPNVDSGYYEWWNGTVWVAEETFIPFTGPSPISVSLWPDRAEAFELGLKAIDSDGMVGGAYNTMNVAPLQTASPPSIASAQAMGNPTIVRGNVNVSPGGIASAQALGAPVVSQTLFQSVLPAGIASGQAFGNPSILTLIAVSPGGIASAQAFGLPVITVGILTIIPAGVVSAEAFGNLTIVPGVRILSPASIVSAEGFGAPSLHAVISVLVAGIASAEIFGAVTVVPGTVILSPSGIISAEAFGIPTVVPPAYAWLGVGLIAKDIRLVPEFSLQIIKTWGSIKILDAPKPEEIMLQNELYKV